MVSRVGCKSNPAPVAMQILSRAEAVKCFLVIFSLLVAGTGSCMVGQPFVVQGQPNFAAWPRGVCASMTSKLSKSISLPGLYKIGTDKPKSFSGNARKTTLGFKTAGNLKSAVDLKRSPEATERSRHLASLLKTGGWRTCYREEEDGPMLQDWAAFTKMTPTAQYTHDSMALQGRSIGFTIQTSTSVGRDSTAFFRVLSD